MLYAHDYFNQHFAAPNSSHNSSNKCNIIIKSFTRSSYSTLLVSLCEYQLFVSLCVRHSCNTYDGTLRAGREYYNANSIAKKLCSILATEDWSKLVSLKLFFTGTMMRLTQMHALIDALCAVPVAAVNSNDSNSDSSSTATPQQQQQHSAMLYRLEVRQQLL
jgi:hypothetical protein